MPWLPAMALWIAQQQQPRPLPSFITIRGVTVVDVENRRLQPGRDVSIPSRSPLVVNGAGKYLLPGLWDMHARALVADPAAYVARGVTGVREMSGASLDEVLAVYRAIESGKVAGPRVIAGGPGVRAETAEEAREAFEKIFETEADFVRFTGDVGMEAYIALAERTRKWRYPLVGPLPPGVRLRDAVELRQSTIEGIAGLERMSRDEACAGFQMAARAGVWFTPGLAAQPRRTRAKAAALVALMRECGAAVLAGPDAVEDVIAMVQWAGLSPYDALRAATVEPGRFLAGREPVTDVVLLEADPVADIEHLHRVAGVVLRGRYLGGEALAALRRPPTLRTWRRPVQSTIPSGAQAPPASSARPPASSAKPGLPTR